MRCLDSSFLIDLLRSVPAALEKAAELEGVQEVLATPALCAAEVLRGAHLGARREIVRTEELLAQLDVLSFDLEDAREAASISTECHRRGREVPLLDCAVAAVARRHRAPLITRDADFAQIPGLLVETY
jgi:predicted nucleic acid-binding protein